MKNFIAICLGVVSLLLSLWAVFHLSPRQYEVDFDYQGLLVGVLSLLVTAILGWQIYNVLTTESRIKRLSMLYQDISEKSKELEENTACSKSYIEALASYVENAIYHKIDKINNTVTIGSLCNDYIRCIETFGMFLKSKNTKYPALCLINADLVLTELSSIINKGNKIPKDFNEICDKAYNDAMNDISVLDAGDIDFFHAIRARRKNLSTDHHNPPATNPWGIRLSGNRIPI